MIVGVFCWVVSTIKCEFDIPNDCEVDRTICHPKEAEGERAMCHSERCRRRKRNLLRY